MPLRAVTLDLDDTLWPFAAVAREMETALLAWLGEHAPAAGRAYDRAATMALLPAIRRERPEIAHDLGAVRREALRRTLGAAGEDPDLAEAGFAVIYDARQRVRLFPDAAPALDRLAARVPLLAVTNGNADLHRTGVARWFTGLVSPSDVGVGKPDPRIFASAAERLGLPPADILHAGDSLELDVEPALAAGFRAAWVQRDIDGEAPAGAVTVPDLGALAALVEREAGPAPRAPGYGPGRQTGCTDIVDGSAGGR